MLPCQTSTVDVWKAILPQIQASGESTPDFRLIAAQGAIAGGSDSVDCQSRFELRVRAAAGHCPTTVTSASIESPAMGVSEAPTSGSKLFPTIPWCTPRNPESSRNPDEHCNWPRRIFSQSGVISQSPAAAPIFSKRGQKDRRSFQRRLSTCYVAICRTNDSATLSVQQIQWLLHAGQLRGRVNNLSMSGLALTLNQPLEPGEDIYLRVGRHRFDDQVTTRGVVTRVEDLGNEQWTIHCQLHEKLSLDQVTRLGQYVLSASAG